MMRELSDPLLSRCGEFIAEHLGLHFPPERAADLQRGIRLAAEEFGYAETEPFARWLLSPPFMRERMEILASHLTVGETYFFRDQRAFETLENQILPELIRLRRGGGQRLRLWSAACCTGEEAYSLALSVRKVLPDLADWQVTILGTDINPRFLGKAARGVFGEWSFRSTAPGFKEDYFTRSGDGRWEIAPEIRKMVSFRQFNLAGDVYPSLVNDTNAMDVIFCRNVLIYFAPGPAARVVRQLAPCLTEGGWLILGPNELSQVAEPNLIPRRFSGATLYQKDLADSGRLGARTSPDEWEAEWEELTLPPAVAEFGAGAPPAPRSLADERVPVERVAAPSEVESGPSAAYERALTGYREGRYAETVETLLDLSRGESVEPQVLALLARTLANQGRLSGALAICDRLVAADKLNPAGHFLRGSVLQELGKPADAVIAFKRTLYLDQDFVLAHFALGNLARVQERFSEADRHLANALVLARRHHPEDLLPEADGLTAGRLVEIVATLRGAAAGNRPSSRARVLP
ncbi:MAG TPA: CheR family methyltransferase [Candidatus Didemnitutus sp.]|jgi:chemotaxis protein methyltransferase CheR